MVILLVIRALNSTLWTQQDFDLLLTRLLSIRGIANVSPGWTRVQLSSNFHHFFLIGHQSFPIFVLIMALGVRAPRCPSGKGLATPLLEHTQQVNFFHNNFVYSWHNQFLVSLTVTFFLEIHSHKYKHA